VFLGVMIVGGSVVADEGLFSFAGGFDPAAVATTDAKVKLVKAAAAPPVAAHLAVETGHAQPWPGITLKAPRGTWDLAKFEGLAVDLRNPGASDIEIFLRIDNVGADGTKNCNTRSLRLGPGEAATLTAPFHRRTAGPAGVKLFGMRGSPLAQDDTGTIDPAQVTQLLLFLSKPTADHRFEVSAVRAVGTYAPPPDAAVPADKFFPLIDTFGQYIHRQWPGKIHAPADLEAARKAEAADLKAHPGPAGWDKFGGWQDGPALKATGFFRTEKVDGRWWLVDPEGRLFFSHGIDCVNAWDATVVTDRAAWFQDFPGARPEFKPLLGKAVPIMGYFQQKNVETFNFMQANLLRKYGPAWRQASAEIDHQRLRSWGMNTIGNWSDGAVTGLDRTPYTATVGFKSRPIAGSSGYWGKFPDPFDPAFKEAATAAMAAQARASAEDPWCIGTFVHNELAWGDDVALAVAVLESPADQSAKKAFVARLKEKYADIAKLNAAWGSTHASWDALLAATAASDKPRATADLGDFTTAVAEEYFRVIRDAVKAAAPNHLYLGCRFAWTNDRAAAAAAKFCDVVSYNRYERSVASLRLPAGATDKPVMIGEFHFGALDRGLFHAGLVLCTSQADRAAAYKAFLRGALGNPAMVGAHWFQYRDQPTTGRSLDEENYQIGFLDVCDTPYAETVTAAREIGAGMYQVRSAKFGVRNAE
jgi:hypothetical protein